MLVGPVDRGVHAHLPVDDPGRVRGGEQGGQDLVPGTVRGEAAASHATGAELLSRQAFIERLERSRRDAIVDLEQRDRQLACDRAALARASQEREVLDQLKDRQRTAHMRKAELAERAEIDDIATQNHVRRHAA